MIRILYGKAKSGKTYKIYSEITTLLNQQYEERPQHLVLLVPEQFTLEAEKQLMAHANMPGIMGVEVLSFKRLAHRVFSDIGFTDQVKISDIGKLMLLRRLFDVHQRKLTVYAKSYNKFGFLSKFHDVIKELKQNQISPSELHALIEHFEDSPLLKNKLQDLYEIYERYEIEKSKVYFDDEDYYNDLLIGIPKSSKLKQMTIWVDGFDSFTSQEYAILAELAKVAQTLTLTMCYDTSSIFEHTRMGVDRMIAFAKHLEIPLKTEKVTRPFENKEIEHIADYLLLYPYEKKSVNPEVIKLFAADNRLDEIENCAIEIVELIRNKGYKWQDIAVVTNDLDAYKLAIKRVFDVYALPYFIDQKLEIAHHPLVHFIRAYLRLYVDRFAHKDIMDLLHTGFLEFSISDISAFELYIKQYGISLNKLKKPFELKPPSGCTLESINTVRERLMTLFIPEFWQVPHIEVPVAISKLYEKMSALKLHEKISHAVSDFTNVQNFEQAQLYAQVWNLTMDLLDQVVALTDDTPLSLEELLDVIEAGFSTLEVGILPLNDDQILVGSMDRSKSHPIKVLFILGVNDGLLPEAGKDQQLILDVEKDLFREKGLNLMADSTLFANKEQFNIYFMLTRPTEKLYFSFSRADAEGAALRPSYLISKLQKICPNLKMISGYTLSSGVPNQIGTKEGTLKHLAYEMRRVIDGHSNQPVWDSVFNWYAINAPQQAQLLVSGLSHSNLVEKLSESGVKKAYETPIKTSVSRLEEYIQCPFKYLVSSGLNPIEIKTHALSAPDVGILFHKSLELFGRSISENQTDWEALDRKTCETIMQDIIYEMTDQEIYQSKFQYRYLIQKLNRVSKKAAWTLTEHLKKGVFTPKAFEVTFGDGGSVPPIYIELANGEKLSIRGVIDRVDVVDIDGVSYCKIIDYKSGRKRLSISDIYHGLQMQLMVYLDACVGHPEYFGKSTLNPAGAFYFRIDDPLVETTEQVLELVEKQIATELKLDGVVLDDVRVIKSLDSELFDHQVSDVIQVKLKADGAYTKDSKLMPLETFHEMMHHVKKTIQSIGDSLLEGVIDILPCKTEGFVSCQFCTYSALCQFDRHLPSNVYKRIDALSNDEVYQRIKGNVNGEMDI